MIRTALILILTLSFSPLAASPADEAWEAYLTGDFDLVKKLVTSSLEVTSLDSTERSRLYLALGCSEAMQGLEASAVKSFESSFLFDPALRLSPADIPPPVWKYFEPVQVRMLKQSERFSKVPADSVIQIRQNKTSDIQESAAGKNETRIDTVFLFRPSPRSAAANLKSIILPGWGHIIEGNRRGYLYAGIELTALTGLVISLVQTNKARRNYLSAKDEAVISDKYDIYNRSYRISFGFALIAISNYFAGQVDFFTSRPPGSQRVFHSPDSLYSSSP